MDDHKKEEFVDFLERWKKTKLPISERGIDKQCRIQPIRQQRVGEIVAKMRSELSRVKDILDRTKADLSIKIRKDPDAYKMDKITDKSVEAMVIMQPDYECAKEELYEAQELYDQLKSLENAFEQRKAMLRDCVTLISHLYYVDSGLAEAADEVRKYTRQRIMEMREANDAMDKKGGADSG
jgi:hypothetical protein